MSDATLIPLIVIAFLIIFPLMWFAVVRLIMAIAGMSRRVDIGLLGEKLGELGTGSARIRGMNFSNCLMVDRYENGYLLRLWKIFGGGQKVILDDDIVEISEGSAVISRSITVALRDGRSIRFFGHLGEMIRESERVRTSEPTSLL